ncbi:MAG: GFA family protein [Gammaproteobacteria bacterium]
MVTLHGGCMCGRHRYTVQLDKPEGYFCHCRMCQQAFGNIFATFVNAPVDCVHWETGEPSYHASSPIARRSFCATCGTPLCFQFNDSKYVDLSAGSLDDPGAVRPVEHTGIESRVASWHEPGALPESRIDDNEAIRARWAAAGATDKEPGGPG